jgi:hypothetical protein
VIPRFHALVACPPPRIGEGGETVKRPRDDLSIRALSGPSALMVLIDFKPRLALEAFIRVGVYRHGPVLTFISHGLHFIPGNVTEISLTDWAELHVCLRTRNVCH